MVAGTLMQAAFALSYYEAAGGRTIMQSAKSDEIGYTERVTISSHRALVNRVVKSAVFAKSERLSSFLQYVCDLTLNGRANEINEQKIGSAVFGRSPDYDSSIDGIVRTQASRLRQRLELYFNDEGAGEPVSIEMPRGGYIPIFRQRAVEPASLEPISSTTPHLEEPAAEIAHRPFWKNAGLAWTVASIIAIAFVAFLLVEHWEFSDKSPPRLVHHPLWSLLIQPSQKMIVVPGDSGLVMWEGVTGNSVNLAGYVNGNYRSRQSIAASPTSIDPINLADRRYTSIVDLELALAISELSRGFGGQVQMRYARDLRPNDFKNGNIVLLGAPEANPWVELFEPNANFVLRNERASRVFSVVNRVPADNEPKHWDSAYNNAQPQPDVYGLVEFLPNLSGTGNVLILEGTSMAGTECAWDFVADDSALLPFLERIKRPNGSLPHFELVLGAKNINGSATKGKTLAWRVYN